jgi:hypothetical protein
MTGRDYEKEVIDYLMEKYPVRVSMFKPELKQITKNWTLEDDYHLVPEDAEDLLIDVFEHFNIDYSNMNSDNYIEQERSIWNIFNKKVKIKPLTVEMIIESAKAGKWLYD